MKILVNQLWQQGSKTLHQDGNYFISWKRPLLFRVVSITDNEKISLRLLEDPNKYYMVNEIVSFDYSFIHNNILFRPIFQCLRCKTLFAYSIDLMPVFCWQCELDFIRKG